jgi:hypothetical protein
MRYVYVCSCFYTHVSSCVLCVCVWDGEHVHTFLNIRSAYTHIPEYIYTYGVHIHTVLNMRDYSTKMHVQI